MTVISAESQTTLSCGCDWTKVHVFKDGIKVSGVKSVNVTTRMAYVYVLEEKPDGALAWDGWSRARIEGVSVRCAHGEIHA